MQRMSVAQFRKLQKGQDARRKKRSTLICLDGEMSEEGEQRILAEFLDGLGLKWFHVPNGGARNEAEGGKLKAQGVKKGVPDNWIVQPPPNGPLGCPGTVIELKRRTCGNVSEEQKGWLEHLEEEGWVTAVCYGAQEAIDLVLKLGYQGPHG